MNEIFCESIRNLKIPEFIKDYIIDLRNVCMEAHDIQDIPKPNSQQGKEQANQTDASNQSENQSENHQPAEAKSNAQNTQEQPQQQQGAADGKPVEQPQNNNPGKVNENKQNNEQSSSNNEIDKELTDEIIKQTFSYASDKIPTVEKELIGMVKNKDINSLKDLGINIKAPITNGEEDNGLAKIKESCMNNAKELVQTNKLDECLQNLKRYVNASLAQA